MIIILLVIKLTISTRGVSKLSEIEKKETEFDLRAFFNSKKGKEILEQSEKDLKKEFMTNTGMFSPEEDEKWAYLKKEI